MLPDIFYKKYSIHPNFIWQMMKDKKIDLHEFVVLSFINSVKLLRHYRTSFSQLEKDIGGIKRESISRCFKSLIEKGLIEIIKTDGYFFTVNLLIDEEIVCVERKVKALEVKKDTEEDIQKNLPENICPPNRQTSAPQTGRYLPPKPAESAPQTGNIELTELTELRENRPTAPTHPILEMFLNKAKKEGSTRCLVFDKSNMHSISHRVKQLEINGTFKSSKDWSDYFDKVFYSDYLSGRKSETFYASFEWLLKDSVIRHILNGKYDNRTEKNDTSEALKTILDIISYGRPRITQLISYLATIGKLETFEKYFSNQMRLIYEVNPKNIRKEVAMLLG